MSDGFKGGKDRSSNLFILFTGVSHHRFQKWLSLMLLSDGFNKRKYNCILFNNRNEIISSLWENFVFWNDW